MVLNLGQWRWIGEGDELTGDKCNTGRALKMVGRVW